MAASEKRLSHQKLDDADFPLEPLERALLCQHLDFELSAPGTVKEQISVVLSHLVCSNVLLQPQETNTRNQKMLPKAPGHCLEPKLSPEGFMAP